MKNTTIKKELLPPLNKKQIEEVKILEAMSDEDIDVVDIPELTNEQMEAKHKNQTVRTLQEK